MTWYDFLLFVHISCAAVWVGGASVMQFFGLRALAAGSADRLVGFLNDIEWIGFRILMPFSLGAFAAGLGLVWNAAFWQIGDDWIVIGLALFALTFLAGLLFFGPEGGRIGKLIEVEGPSSPAVQERIRRLIVLTRVDLVVLFLIFFDMTVKPTFDDGWTIVGALLAAAVLAALLVAPASRRPAAVTAE
jgi:uncharacterized membrane protein